MEGEPPLSGSMRANSREVWKMSGSCLPTPRVPPTGLVPLWNRQVIVYSLTIVLSDMEGLLQSEKNRGHWTDEDSVRRHGRNRRSFCSSTKRGRGGVATAVPSPSGRGRISRSSRYELRSRVSKVCSFSSHHSPPACAVAPERYPTVLKCDQGRRGPSSVGVLGSATIDLAPLARW